MRGGVLRVSQFAYLPSNSDLRGCSRKSMQNGLYGANQIYVFCAFCATHPPL